MAVGAKSIFLEKGYYQDLPQFWEEKTRKKKTRKTIAKLIGFHANTHKKDTIKKGYIKIYLNFEEKKNEKEKKKKKLERQL